MRVKDIGFQHNLPKDGDWDKSLTPAIRNRIDLLDDRLRAEGFRLFIYSPASIDPENSTVEGYRREAGRFVPVEAPIPAVNGNWTGQTRRLLARGMGYDAFRRWIAAHGVGIYVPHSLSDLLGNKLETYRLVRAFHETLHPHCETFRTSVSQIEHFVEASPLTFIKPRIGSKGDGIVVLRRTEEGLVATRYHGGRRRVARAARVTDLMDSLVEMTSGRRRFIIQHGIETVRHTGSTFDIRVTMAHDGSVWRWLHEARLSPSGSDVSNVGQGGRSHATDQLLFEIFGTDGTRDVLRELRDLSFGLAAHLEQLHPREIPELAFDFTLDTDAHPRLIEINTKPGLPGPGTNVYLRDLTAEHAAAFENWVFPHADRIASFLISKMGTVPRAIAR